MGRLLDALLSETTQTTSAAPAVGRCDTARIDGDPAANPANPANPAGEIRRFATFAGGEPLSRALAARIERMAQRWRYDAEELAWALAEAQRNPMGWLSAVEADEELADKLRRTGRSLI